MLCLICSVECDILECAFTVIAYVFRMTHFAMQSHIVCSGGGGGGEDVIK